MTMSLALELTVEQAPFLAVLDELTGLAAEAPEGFCDGLAGLAERAAELIHLDVDHTRAAAAGELTITLQPSELMLRLLATARAGDFDLGVFERVGHRGCSAGCVEAASGAPAPAGLQGPAGDHPQFAEATEHPGFREVIDNLRWDEMR